MKNREEAAVFLKNAPEDDLEFKGSPSISNIATPAYRHFLPDEPTGRACHDDFTLHH